MNKRIITIFALLALVLIGGAAYWYFSKSSSTTDTTLNFPGGSTTSPTGNGGLTGGVPDDGDATPQVSGEFALPRLYQLHTTPVAGIGFAETKDKKGVLIGVSARYIERSLGNIFETDLSSYTESRIVNETRPHLSEALWGNGGKSVVVRFVDDVSSGTIKTHIVNILSSSSSSTLNSFMETEEYYLPDAIPFMATAEDGSDNLFYLEANNGELTTFNNLGGSRVFNSVFTEWLPQFPNKSLVTLTTRPSAMVPGHLFFLDVKTKAVSKILDEINGLTTLTSHDGKFILFSETKDGAPQLSIYDGTKKLSLPLYVRTLADKCVWGNKNTLIAYCAVPDTLTRANYPDQWYQGLVSFTDTLWEIDATSFTSRKIMTPSSLGIPSLDMTNLSLSSDDTYLVFINKIDGSPWLYNIVERPSPSPEETTTPSTVTTPSSAVTPDMQKLN